MMSPPFFPIGPEELDGLWEFDALEEGTHAFEDLEVLAREVPHKGGRTFGYRITDPSGHSLAYVPDHSPIQHGEGPQGLGEYHEAIVALTRDVDVLFHDAQHTAEEFEAVRGLGHSSIEYAIGLAENVGVKKLQLFHHSPNRDDDSLDALMASLPHSQVQVEAAREGTVLSFP
jgi:phosphoribosyl 1,2-cyclic phosphodiesterase